MYPNFKEESLWSRYVAAIYWSIVTLTTTGYDFIILILGALEFNDTKSVGVTVYTLPKNYVCMVIISNIIFIYIYI